MKLGFLNGDAGKDQRGSALILVVMLMSLLIFIPVGTQLLKTSREQVRRFSSADAQALNIARAGLQDAIAWFQRQNNGLPVTGDDPAFAPVAPDTIDATIGLVKEA